MTYHSNFNEEGKYPTACGLAILPIKTKTQGNNESVFFNLHLGPATKSDTEAEDVIDEAIAQFRANVFFKNYEVRGPADKVIIYLTVYIQKCLEVIAKNPVEAEAKKSLMALMAEAVPSPS